VVSGKGSAILCVKVVPTVSSEILAVPFGKGHKESGRYAKNIGPNPVALIDHLVDPLSGRTSGNRRMYAWRRSINNGSAGDEVGMVIDLQKCTGCGECVAACKLENNVAIVNEGIGDGPDHALDGHADDVRRRISRLRVRQFRAPACIAITLPARKSVRSVPLQERGRIVAQIYPQCIGCRYCMAACPTR